jgi:hypothetical protein
MGPNRRAQGRERAAARAAEEATRAEAEGKAIADAQEIVAISDTRSYAPGISMTYVCRPTKLWNRRG